ncbi:MAG: hypothetical protein J7K98_03670 [Candidatus Aenigmarchaeota archaeon]|nr:hypothetical protein [Candidatus Aenigmarchaeota archaeon]
MKGQTQELIWLVSTIIIVMVMFLFFYYQFGTKGIEVKKAEEERNLDEAATLALLTLYNNRLPFVEKYYIQTAIDAILRGDFLEKATEGKFSEKDKVFYGEDIGKVNVTEIIPPLFEKYFGNRWKLTIKTPKGTFEYGHSIKEEEILYSYSFTIPVPEEKFGMAILEIGRPK